MLHCKSKPDEVLHYISQMENLLLSSQEQEQINKILSLSNIVTDSAIKALIAEDLQDEKWINDTKVLINTCKKKLEKNNALQKHLEECKNFIVYRFLEEKTFQVDLEIYKQMSGWNFNEIDKTGEKYKWVSQKFLRSFDTSNLQRQFEKLFNENNIIKINLKWLHQNKSLFFTEDLFSEIKI